MLRLLTFVLVCQTASSQELMSSEKTLMVFWGFYHQPSYSVLTSIIRSIDVDPGTPSHKGTMPAIMAFYAVAIQRYPDKIKSLNDLSDDLANTKMLLRDAIRLSQNRDAIFNWQERKPITIDMLWGAYFASGEPRYLKRIVSEMLFIDRTDSLNVTLTGFAAEYTFAIYAQMFPEVKQYLQDAMGNASPNLIPHIHEALYMSPEHIREEAMERSRQIHNRTN